VGKKPIHLLPIVVAGLCTLVLGPRRKRKVSSTRNTPAGCSRGAARSGLCLRPENGLWDGVWPGKSINRAGATLIPSVRRAGASNSRRQLPIMANARRRLGP